ncbi:hypothetical protein DLAC_09844 [Tieghemostelium lacteum]|uniref:PIH1 domain-containing protein 1 n=1 Tax=Tieghemostelium lacteum TaxID=361077 RepID=A0A151Z7C9_TIELA|nr:hypothetical protein DLAC_09844 [Tieghemostelium lacteum]|eukprot:KYQ89870.1 hypothetical protein DLAC_09844 [Tieghemostelium lacteum]
MSKEPDEENLELNENNFKDLSNTFKDPIIFDTLLKYYDELEKEIDTNNNTPTPTTNSSNSNSNKNNSNNNNNSLDENKKQKRKTKRVSSYHGMCFKTHSDRAKEIYVNISHYPSIAPLSLTQHDGWIIPYSLYPVTTQQCSYQSPHYQVYHIVFGTETYNESQKNKPLSKLLIQTSIQAIYQTYKETLDILAIKQSKKVFAKDFLVEEVEQPEVDILSQPEEKESIDKDTGYLIPIYKQEMLGIDGEVLTNPVVLPTSIRYEILLPSLNLDNFQFEDLNLEIDDKALSISQSSSPQYYLTINLPHPIQEQHQDAKFIKSKKLLKIKLMVEKDTINSSVGGCKHDHSHEHHHHHDHHNHNSTNPIDLQSLKINNNNNFINLYRMENQFYSNNNRNSYFIKKNYEYTMIIVYCYHKIIRNSLIYNFIENGLEIKFQSNSEMGNLEDRNTESHEILVINLNSMIPLTKENLLIKWPSLGNSVIFEFKNE